MEPPYNNTTAMTVSSSLQQYLDPDHDLQSNKSEPPPDMSEEQMREYFNYELRARVILARPDTVVALLIVTMAIVANVLSLVAICHIRSSLTAHFRILVSLIMSDLLIDVSYVGHILNTIFNPTVYPGYGDWQQRVISRCAFLILKAFNTMGLNITLLNLVAMAIDHYVAIIHPFHLSVLLSRQRTTLMIVIIWVLAFITGFSGFLSPLGAVSTRQHEFNLCEQAWISEYQEEYTMFAIALFCFLLMLYIYLKIYCSAHEKYKSSRQSLRKTNKRALVTTLLILGTFVVCWLPTCLLNIVMIIVIKVDNGSGVSASAMSMLQVVDKYLFALMLLNTLLDPIIYAVRITEVRRGYLLLFRSCTSEGSLLRDKLHRRYSRSSDVGLSLQVQFVPRRRASAAANAGATDKFSAAEQAIRPDEDASDASLINKAKAKRKHKKKVTLASQLSRFRSKPRGYIQEDGRDMVERPPSRRKGLISVSSWETNFTNVSESS